MLTLCMLCNFASYFIICRFFGKLTFIKTFQEYHQGWKLCLARSGTNSVQRLPPYATKWPQVALSSENMYMYIIMHPVKTQISLHSLIRVFSGCTLGSYRTSSDLTHIFWQSQFVRRFLKFPLAAISQSPWSPCFWRIKFVLAEDADTLTHLEHSCEAW